VWFFSTPPSSLPTTFRRRKGSFFPPYYYSKGFFRLILRSSGDFFSEPLSVEIYSTFFSTTLYRSPILLKTLSGPLRGFFSNFTDNSVYQGRRVFSLSPYFLRLNSQSWPVCSPFGKVCPPLPKANDPFSFLSRGPITPPLP